MPLSRHIGTARTLMRRNAPAIPIANLIADYRFDEGSGQLLRNYVASPPSVANLFAAPEQVFANANTAWWAKGGAPTLTDYAGTDPFGNNNASRFVGSAAGNRHISQIVTLPAGAHTISISVKSNTGASQGFRMSLDNGATFSTEQTATTSWQRFSYTASPGAGTTNRIIIFSNAAQDALDLLIYGAQLEAGSSASPYTPQVLDSVLGKSGAADANDPTWSTGYLGFQGSKYTFGAQSVPSAVAQLSCYAVCRWTGSEVGAGYAPIINEDWSAQRFGLAGEESSQASPRARFASATAIAWLSTLNDSTWHIVSMTYDGTNLIFYLDGVELARTTSAALSTTIQRIYFSNINGGFFWPGDIAYTAVYSAAHNAAARASVVSTLRTLMAARGITVNTITKMVAAEGDSITDSAVAVNKGYVSLALRAIPTPATTQAYLFALSGSSLSHMNTRAARVDALYDPTRAKNILSVLIGRNDLPSVSAATFVADLKTYCLARRAAGWTILLGTILPSTLAGFNTKRNAANALIYGDPSFYDALFDFAADATMGPDAAASDTLLYSDGTHPTALGQTNLKTIWQTAVTGLL